MRIEGAYTFAATSDRVYGALLDADTLARTLPGCERVMQMGPTDASGRARYEVRVVGSAGTHSTTVSLHAKSARRPDHLSLELSGYGPAGAFTGGGRIDLVAQETHTVVAYVWDMTFTDASDVDQTALVAGCRMYARALCEGLNQALLTETDVAPLPDGGVALVTARTSRGSIVALRRRAPAPALAFRASVWTQRAIWMGTGFAIGVGAIGLTLNALRRIAEQERG